MGENTWTHHHSPVKLFERVLNKEVFPDNIWLGAELPRRNVQAPCCFDLFNDSVLCILGKWNQKANI